MSIQFHRAAKTTDVPTDRGLHLKIADRDIALFQLGGEFYAIGGICTHGATRLAPGFIIGELIECPNHGGTFEIKTGRAVDYPCAVNVKKYDVRVEGDEVFIGWEPVL